MRLTNRSKNIIDGLIIIGTILFFYVVVITTGVIGQDNKQDRLQDDSGTIPPVTYTR